ncbi:MAG: hypothetical protein FWH03_03490 [Firmicutes bacterium]|nr:hypothetical protein [Bacillota bacterium]
MKKTLINILAIGVILIMGLGGCSAKDPNFGQIKGLENAAFAARFYKRDFFIEPEQIDVSEAFVSVINNKAELSIWNETEQQSGLLYNDIDEWNNFYLEHIDIYDNDFFEKNQLVLIVFLDGLAFHNCSVNEIRFQDNVLYVNFETALVRKGCQSYGVFPAMPPVRLAVIEITKITNNLKVEFSFFK